MAKKRRRVRGRGSVEDLGTRGWRARVRGRSLTGAKFDLQRTCPTRDEAERALVGLVSRARDIEAGLVAVEDECTLAEWKPRALRAGLPWRRADGSTWKMLRPLWHVPMVALDAGRVRGWAERLRRTYAPATVRSAAILLKRIVRFAVDKRVLARVPWGDMPLALVKEAECGRREGLEPHEWERIRETARAIDAAGGGGALHDLWLRLAVLLVTGMRPLELTRAEYGDIVASPHGPALRNGNPAKKGKPGDKPLGVELADALAAHRERMPDQARRTALLFPMKGTRGRWRPRWRPSKDGRPQGRFMVTPDEIRALREGSGITSFVLYQLRHTRLTELAQLSPQLAQDVGGHRQQRTTQRYVHSSTRHLRPEAFDTSALLGTVPAPEPPPNGGGPGGGGKRRAGRFMVHDGGGSSSAPPPAAAPTAAKALASAPTTAKKEGAHPPAEPTSAQETKGRAVDPELPESGDVAPYLEAIRAHGCDYVARGIVASIGPAEAIEDMKAVAGFVASARCPDDWTASLTSLIARVRAHAFRGPVSTVPSKTGDMGDIF